MGAFFLEQAANSEFIRFGHAPRNDSLLRAGRGAPRHADVDVESWMTLLELGKVDTALPILRKCFNSRCRVPGDQHLDTIAAAKFLMGFEQESESDEAY